MNWEDIFTYAAGAILLLLVIISAFLASCTSVFVVSTEGTEITINKKMNTDMSVIDKIIKPKEGKDDGQKNRKDK